MLELRSKLSRGQTRRPTIYKPPLFLGALFLLEGSPAKTFVQFGVQVRNGTNGDIQICMASILVEPKERL